VRGTGFLVPAGTTRFEALGTYVHLSTRQHTELDAALELAKEILADIDATCSRFREDSDLTQVNRHPGIWVEADPLLVHAVQAACTAAEQTCGLVNPLLGAALVQLGYDRDFGLLEHQSEQPATLLGPGPGIDSWRAIELDLGGGIRIPKDTALDLGSTAKAWTADLIATAFESHLTHGALISLGGDIGIAQPLHDAEPWAIAISEQPGQPADQTISLASGGLATSSTRVRHWRRNGALRHHLLDPRTGLPCHEVWRTVTAIGATCVAANTASTVAIVLGDQASDWLTERGISARLVAADGSVSYLGQWPAPTPSGGQHAG
jgi:FAD:protein FMN transferase